MVLVRDWKEGKYMGEEELFEEILVRGHYILVLSRCWKCQNFSTLISYIICNSIKLRDNAIDNMYIN